jgi:hypothetical protein
MVTSVTRSCSPRSAADDVDLVVLTIDDQAHAVRAAAMIRSHAPQVTIVARARDLASCDALLRAGVNTAFPRPSKPACAWRPKPWRRWASPTTKPNLLLRGVRSADYALVRYGPEGKHPPGGDKPRTDRFQRLARSRSGGAARRGLDLYGASTCHQKLACVGKPTPAARSALILIRSYCLHTTGHMLHAIPIRYVEPVFRPPSEANR